MTTGKRFTAVDAAAFDQAKFLGIRAGTTHRYTNIWVVVVEGRPFVRSWNDKPMGWYRALRSEPLGTVVLGGKRGREVPIRAELVRSERLRRSVTAAYARKYDTPGSQKWVRGFAEPTREATTLELVPAE
jgi:hypothetical protein